ncbi:type II CAAX endopeptidase family protein [Lactiplantibacillus pentosus]|uniref:CPBP family intramembrane glutamic endopeptidase n=1 Tax=Lactiplantibacillus pentosus TaxID=1589 RepID=UPI0027090E51|nr:type II CAAX endopeptidase family protein [Lactiplantibacillus pentosus]MDO7806540.1 type II CAAX endopeptidase family protein [Lactiplantibacillus pentosus]
MQIIKNLVRIVLIIILFLVTFVVIQLPTLSEAFWPNETSKNLNITTHVLVFVSMTAIAMSVVIFLYNRTNAQKLFGQPITLKNLCIMLLFAFGSQCIQYLISLGKSSGSDSSIISAVKSPLCLITITTLIIVSPLLEEILFQGVLQGGLLNKVPSIMAIFITAVVFAFFHGYSISISTLELFVSGISYALVYFLTEDIKMSFMAHSISNCIVLLLDILK